ncbi:MAG: transcriptional activator NhaR [Candidatus Eisenbacteria bacterium]|nr:transcriptional activator NhaR [Candidatus Eisenbacteria bacterium]
MEWLNYHHFLYFWMVAREGSIVRASKELRLAQPTVSGQIRRLEEMLGEKLFRRVGRRLVLTDVGRVAFRYADEIFTLGREFVETVRGQAAGHPLRLVVGVTNAVPKAIVQQLIEPALQLGEPVRLVCREDRSLEGFLSELAVHGLDVVLSDAPAGSELPVKLFSHLLGETGTCFFANPRVAATLHKRFPGGLNGAPFLLPGRNAALRRSLEDWFESQKLRPRIVGEIDDSALLKVLGEAGVGVFAGPSAIEADVVKRYRVRVVGRVGTLRQRFYAISAERRLSHPAVVAICNAGRKVNFRGK